MLVLYLIGALCLFLVLYCYGVYPLMVRIWASLSTHPPSSPSSSIPHIDILLSVYNEEDIIATKLANLEALQYPSGSMRIWIGSDFSTDSTNDLIAEWASSKSYVHFVDFRERRGKSAVINDLAALASAKKYSVKDAAQQFFLFTDASVMCPPDILLRMKGSIDLEKVDIIDFQIVPEVRDRNGHGIGESEKQYLGWETKLKKAESRLWNRCMGVFGGFFLLRKSYFTPVPHGFAVDDFFLMMSAYLQGASGIIWDEVPCTEPHSDSESEEFKRKKRISRGNWQNLRFFWRKLKKAPFSLQFSFYSHKLLRWLTPYLMAIHVLCACLLLILGVDGWMKIYCFAVFVLLLTVFGIHALLVRMGVHIKLLKSVRYFLLMNIALVIGGINNNNGKSGSIWEPPKRK